MLFYKIKSDDRIIEQCYVVALSVWYMNEEPGCGDEGWGIYLTYKGLIYTLSKH